MKSRVYLLIAVGVGLVFIVLLGALVLREKEQEIQLSSIAMSGIGHETKTSDRIEISDKWVEVNHANFWNNSNLFANGKYHFPNIKFSYPEGWKFSCCNDMDSTSVHNIFSSQKSDTTLPYIRLTDYSLVACPNTEVSCSLDKQVKVTALEKFKQLTSSIPTSSVLSETTLSNLNKTVAFVYQKQETSGKLSKVYLVNLGDGVIEIDFVNYELINNSESFIGDFLKNFSFEREDRLGKQWKIYENNTYSFKFQYPSTYLFDENLMQGPEYSISFGHPLQGASEKASERVAGRNFEISIYENGNSVDSLVEKENSIRRAIEQTSESIGTEKVANTVAKIIKACDIEGNCNKIVYFSHGKLIYSIYMQNYFSTTEVGNKSDADVMLSSFQIE